MSRPSGSVIVGVSTTVSPSFTVRSGPMSRFTTATLPISTPVAICPGAVNHTGVTLSRSVPVPVMPVVGA